MLHGKKEYELEIGINDAIYASSSRYLVIGQKNGQALYQIEGGAVTWQKEVEGQIQKISVNRNGYVSVIVTGSSYKNIVITYNSSRKRTI